MHINLFQSGKKKKEKKKKNTTERKPVANINAFTFPSLPCLVVYFTKRSSEMMLQATL